VANPACTAQIDCRVRNNVLYQLSHSLVDKKNNIALRITTFSCAMAQSQHFMRVVKCYALLILEMIIEIW
jgi:hypothetical protein